MKVFNKVSIIILILLSSINAQQLDQQTITKKQLNELAKSNKVKMVTKEELNNILNKVNNNNGLLKLEEEIINNQNIKDSFPKKTTITKTHSNFISILISNYDKNIQETKKLLNLVKTIKNQQIYTKRLIEDLNNNIQTLEKQKLILLTQKENLNESK